MSPTAPAGSARCEPPHDRPRQRCGPGPVADAGPRVRRPLRRGRRDLPAPRGAGLVRVRPGPAGRGAVAVHPPRPGPRPGRPLHRSQRRLRRPAVKLTTEPGALAGAVKFAARALTARAAYPILSGLKITADPDGTVEVSAFDYETSARARIGAEVSEPGTVLTPGRLLAEIAALLPRQPAELAGDGAALALACGSTRYRLHLLPLDGYPALPELPAPAGHAGGAEFAAAARQVVVAASRDDTPPALGAVQVTFAADALTLVATDRDRK